MNDVSLPLRCAVEAQDALALKLLVPTATPSAIDAAMLLAIERGHLDVVLSLLEHTRVRYLYVERAVACGQVRIALHLNQRAGDAVCALPSPTSCPRSEAEEDKPVRAAMWCLAKHLLSSPAV
ncbi:hypothetical protein SPRG_11825 [Saprolegnia parasitica CBS 223.65]|uniref:Uncharacterized protein n=1 Tax=Saprolegnia parasitica (strain CBS 223.65) TaxID=695850 RepID=A0A067BXG2_SAPPC|nr:hypothetical protein SPRG_11825 [Saprolegnia parasitica CBS 223.65]KDO22978.1 hypothetical protein SPRG_11825 [Saprolegnia parasitica CBS 223.65]|eukprot:XP_012206269.1 hypothetical protein SPRG_11825 [Saprolegnia parasitica CBS 223.65]